MNDGGSFELEETELPNSTLQAPDAHYHNKLAASYNAIKQVHRFRV